MVDDNHAGIIVKEGKYLVLLTPLEPMDDVAVATCR